MQLSGKFSPECPFLVGLRLVTFLSCSLHNKVHNAVAETLMYTPWRPVRD